MAPFGCEQTGLGKKLRLVTEESSRGIPEVPEDYGFGPVERQEESQTNKVPKAFQLGEREATYLSYL